MSSMPSLPSEPFISVVIPTFRRPHTLRRAIDSILDQDFADWEIVVSDDEQPAGASSSLVAEYARRDRRIRLVGNHRARGQIGNTNNAMLSARGRWIKLLHDDDWLAAGALRRFAEVARSHASAVFLTCAANLVLDHGIKPYVPPGRRAGVCVHSGQQLLVDLYLLRTTRHIGIVPSTLLVNRRHVEAGCLMRSYGSLTQAVDQLFYVDLACRGEVVIIPEGLVYYDDTMHASVGKSTPFPEIDRETLELKRLTFSLIEDKARLPRPEAVTRALRVARLRSRYRQQSFWATVRDASSLLRPSVLRLVQGAVAARLIAMFYGSLL